MSDDQSRDEMMEELRGKSTDELKEMLRKHLAALGDHFAPRIYVYFQEDTATCKVDAGNVARPEKITFGPYHDVEISNGVIYVSTPDTPDDEGTCFALATREGDAWVVHDGSEDGGFRFGLVRINTVPPRQSLT